MKVIYEIWRDLVAENEYGALSHALQHDKLYATESYEDAWKKYFELRSSYIFRWTKSSVSILRFVRNES